MSRVRGVAITCLLGALVLAGCSGASPTTPGAGAATGGGSRPATAPASPRAPDLAAGQRATLTYCSHQQARVTEPASLHGPAPAAVYVHGGSWVSGDYATGGFIIDAIGPALADAGFVVVSLDYRLGPTQHWPDQIEDVKCAIRYLRTTGTPPHRPERDRRMGTECGRASRRAPRHSRPVGRLGCGCLPHQVEQGGGGGRHGRTE